MQCKKVHTFVIVDAGIKGPNVLQWRYFSAIAISGLVIKHRSGRSRSDRIHLHAAPEGVW